jgi:hypothetical protein
VLASLIASIVASFNSSINANKRVAGGRPASITTMPHSLFLHFEYEYAPGEWRTRSCGAGLVTSLVALTSAQCVRQYGNAIFNADDTEHESYVVWGLSDLREDVSPFSKRSKIVAVDTISNYDQVTQQNDIALVLLQKPVPLAPMSLSTQKVQNDQRYKFAGWGFKQGDEATTQLQIAEIKVVADENCESLYTDYNRDNQLCVDNGSPTACFGDYGSPLGRNLDDGSFEAMGVFSYDSGTTCGFGSVAVMTHVQPYRDFFILPRINELEKLYNAKYSTAAATTSTRPVVSPGVTTTRGPTVPGVSPGVTTTTTVNPRLPSNVRSVATQQVLSLGALLFAITALLF